VYIAKRHHQARLLTVVFGQAACLIQDFKVLLPPKNSAYQNVALSVKHKQLPVGQIFSDQI